MVKSNIDLNVVNTVLLVVILCLVVWPCLRNSENYQSPSAQKAPQAPKAPGVHNYNAARRGRNRNAPKQ